MGTEFVLVFPINYKSNKKVHLYIVSKEKTFTGNVTSPYTTVNQNFSTSNGYKTVSLSPNVQLSEGRSDKVIFVKTDKPVSVYGFDTYSCCSGEAFNVLPKPFLGKHYIAFSVDPHFDSYLVIISTAQGTKVSINWKLSKYVTVEGNRYLNGDKMTLTIDDMESIQILSTGDITGTTITSTNPVAVLSGNKCPDLTSSSACNQIIEYLQPSEKCGRRFIIPPMYGDRDSTKLLKVVATANRTRLTIRGGSLKVNRTIDMDDVDKTRLKMYETYAVEATENVCVIVAADIGHSTNDPVLTQVPALGQFVHEVVIPKPTIETFSNFVSIVANSSALSDLRINNQAPVTNDLKRITIDFAEYVSFWTPLENGTSTYHINATSPTSYFGVIAHGSKHSQAYAFPVGLKLG
ncbi:hypothetical protein FSP39_017382 [Pinctada imbricata]|uniref:IgGFc-binding protein N-terminal domain-containing protein n=1 Tax=Pinctada imbricata TaxID=66713 RepID=A0AA88YNM1_PINIB|nr:hypothetical protein FSP39_017382 [Pinctada imbricata]